MSNAVFNALCLIIGWKRPITASTPLYVVDKEEYLWQLGRYRYVMQDEWEGYSDSQKRLWVYPRGPWNEGPLYWSSARWKSMTESSRASSRFEGRCGSCGCARGRAQS